MVYDQQGNLINGTDADDVVNQWLKIANSKQTTIDEINAAIIAKLETRIAELEAKQDKD